MGYVFLSAVSVIMSAFAWRRIFLKKSSWPIKAACFALSAIPLAGPIFYFLIDPADNQPTKMPPEKLWKAATRGTAVWPSFDPLINFLRNLFKL